MWLSVTICVGHFRLCNRWLPALCPKVNWFLVQLLFSHTASDQGASLRSSLSLTVCTCGGVNANAHSCHGVALFERLGDASVSFVGRSLSLVVGFQDQSLSLPAAWGSGHSALSCPPVPCLPEYHRAPQHEDNGLNRTYKPAPIQCFPYKIAVAMVPLHNSRALTRSAPNSLATPGHVTSTLILTTSLLKLCHCDAGWIPNSVSRLTVASLIRVERTGV